ncbi:MAG: PAS domain S-box protein [Hyphomicrobium sp.]|jgi:PAS domain S-box-containing protein|nr:PAS domain S-box protein [Hyphomicrobium sp.]
MTTDNQKVGETSAATKVTADATGSEKPGMLDEPGVQWQFFEASPDGVKILDLDGRPIFVNANGLKALEADFESIGSRKWIELWPEASRVEVEHAFAQALSGQSARFTALRPTQKGVLRWWDVVISPIKDRSGNVVNLMSISRDVTPSLTLADTLRRSEQQFQALANNIAQLAWMADRDGNLFWLNKRWLDFTGSTLDTSLGQGWRVFHHPDHIARVVDKWTRCIREGHIWEDLFPLRGADGAYRWFLSRAMPVRNASGEIEFWCGTNTDVTETRRQSQRLRKLARIVELSHEAMLVREIGGRIVMWNRGCEELFGFTKPEAFMKTSHALLSPRNLPAAAEFDEMVRTNGSWSGEVHYIASDGTDVWVDSRQELVRIGEKNVILETNRDITERRQADQVRSLLVAELNHRVKNTLAVVQSIAAQTARSRPSPEKFVSSFSGRLQSLAMAHNVLSEVAWAGAPIVELIRSQIAMMGSEAGRIELEGPSIDLPPQTALQLALILHELCTNAMQHGALSTPDGKIIINWTIDRGDPPLVRLNWRETGGPSVRPPVERGFGLTLIDRSKSLPNIATSIAFDPSGIEVEIACQARGDAGEPSLFNPGRKIGQPRVVPDRKRDLRPRVLIMDASLSRTLLLEDMLESAGYATSGPVSSAEAALDSLVSNKIGLVALDVDEIAGNDIEKVLAELADRHLPCIAIGTSARLAQIKAGAYTALVAKPIDRDTFLRAVCLGLNEHLEPDGDTF